MNFTEQLEYLDKLEALIAKKAAALAGCQPGDSYRSTDINELIASLSKAQGQYPQITFNRKDAYFQEGYADFNCIMTAVRPIMSQHGLAVYQQQRIHDGGATMLHTILSHTSGQWIESRARILPLKEGVNVYESELNKQKSLALQSLLGISITNDPADDNGYVAMQPTRMTSEKGTALNLSHENLSRETVTKEQLEELEYELAEYPDLAKMILDQWKLQALADMPKNKYLAAIKKIREIKLLRSGIKNQ
jgi:hypothetical protein